MKIFIITTPNDPARTASMAKELDGQEDVDKLDITAWPAVMNTNSPQVGISASHRGVIQQAKDLELPEVCILEDDTHFLCRNSLVKFLNTYKLLPKATDMLFGGIYDGEIGKEFCIYAELEGRISGLHCYIIKQKFYDKFLSADPDFNLDFWISTELKPVAYVSWPFLVIQNEGYSYNRRGQSAHNYELDKRYKLANCK